MCCDTRMVMAKPQIKIVHGGPKSNMQDVVMDQGIQHGCTPSIVAASMVRKCSDRSIADGSNAVRVGRVQCAGSGSRRNRHVM
eukprot:scaffold300487_cov18-Tisochrysis_lutea.AAC.1